MLHKLLKSKTHMPAKVPTDRVVPMRFFDNTTVFQAVIFHTMLAFDDVLDPKKLRSSLEDLIRHEGWQKLGARMRRNEAGQVEYHIPAEFTSDRPAVKYSHANHSIPIADHPVASQIPKPSQELATFANAEQFHCLMCSPDTNHSIDDYLNNDDPQLGLHVVSFTDATLVTLHWSHTLFDAMGKMAVLNAWSLMLQGRHEEIRMTYPENIDPLAKLGQQPTEPHKLSGHLMSLFYPVCHMVRTLNEILFSRLQRRVIRLPQSLLTSLRATALQELTANSPDDTAPFLSEGDVLTAWWIRISTTQLSKDSSRLVVVNNAQSLRPVLSGDLLSFSSTYISNAFQMITFMLSSADILTRPLSFVASKIRQSIVDFGQRGQVEAYAALWRSSRFNLFPIFGNASMYFITCTNWSKAKLFDVEFSAAVIQPRTPATKPQARVGKPSYVQYHRVGMEGLVGPNVLVVLGKDADGNYWLDGCVDQRNWSKIEQTLNMAKEGLD